MVNVGDPAVGRSRCLSRREVQRPHRARLAGARPGDAHGADGSRDSRIRDYRLKPGMYAQGQSRDRRPRRTCLIVPKIALVDSEGQRGVYQPSDDSRAQVQAGEGRHRGQRAARRSSRACSEGEISRVDRRRRAAPQRSTRGRRRRRAAADGARGGGRGDAPGPRSARRPAPPAAPAANGASATRRRRWRRRRRRQRAGRGQRTRAVSRGVRRQCNGRSPKLTASASNVALSTVTIERSSNGYFGVLE